VERTAISLLVLGLGLSYAGLRRLIFKNNRQAVFVALTIGSSLVIIGVEMLILALR